MVKVDRPECIFKDEDFFEFCNRYKFKFPQAFIEYLKEFNDAELEPNVIDVGDNECCIRYFYGTSDNEYSDIGAVYEYYKERMPKKCVPIADPDFGNQICISLSEETYGTIYFWDHETMDTNMDGICMISLEDMFKIADSFDELLYNIK